MTYHGVVDPMPTVYIQFSGPSFQRLQVQQALTGAHRARGMMHRSLLPGHRGMLLSWPDDASSRKLWMRSTLISLDAIFIAANGTIVGILEYMAPESDDLETVGVPAQHVLEVNGGFVAEHGVAIGQRVFILPAGGLLAAMRSETP